MANHLSYDVLSSLVERRVSATEEARAQRHLVGCGRCRSELDWLERIRSQPRDVFEGGFGLGETNRPGFSSQAEPPSWAGPHALRRGQTARATASRDWLVQFRT